METGIWKEMVAAHLRDLHGVFSEETKEINSNNSGKCTAIHYSIPNEI